MSEGAGVTLETATHSEVYAELVENSVALAADHVVLEDDGPEEKKEQRTVTPDSLGTEDEGGRFSPAVKESFSDAARLETVWPWVEGAVSQHCQLNFAGLSSRSHPPLFLR
jgi:hypothetical protein